ncbi:MAG: dTDP-4-dehydrorhamnose reductase [Gammaproteobacteria bacterium]|nr:dTDP-4-dehydrorhamnose reductase [Gammaproteobacteria bacterium]MCF6230089.1 dTDP-4-dehydrorhamnose reductase [Gammaproteobacteria bacterium]
MKVLITGSQGQVGRELMALAASHGCEAVGFERNTLDITDQVAVQKTVAQQQPDAVINAAAYTAVDKAESDAEAALAVNATAVGYLAQACADLKIPLVHISTDYVFDGSKQGAYFEGDALSPLGVYGETKLAGEEAVKTMCSAYYILRTSWVFSPHGSNFVKTMLRLAAERETLGVVADQHGKPTSAQEIAKTVYRMLMSNKRAWGTYHIAQPNVTTWFDFAEAIFLEAKNQHMALKISTLNAIASKDYSTPAKRPVNSELNCTKLEETFEIKLQPWAESLTEVINTLAEASAARSRKL